MCDACWRAQEGDRRPHRVIDYGKLKCCFCGTPTGPDVIFVRALRAASECKCERDP